MRPGGYVLNYSQARSLSLLASSPATMGDVSKRIEAGELHPVQLAVTDGAASAAGATGQLVSCTVQLLKFDFTSSPATMSDTGMIAITAWNPFTEDIPDGTYVIITKVPSGWVITQVLNYCP